MGDPYKRKKTIKFLIMTAIIGISAAAVSTFAQTLSKSVLMTRLLHTKSRHP
jgi:hypothetical protein